MGEPTPLRRMQPAAHSPIREQKDAKDFLEELAMTGYRVSEGILRHEAMRRSLK